MTADDSIHPQPADDGDAYAAVPARDPAVPAPVLDLGFLDLFTKATDGTDRLLMLVGLLGAAGYGALMPVLAVLLGDVVGPFIDFDSTPVDADRDAALAILRAHVVKQVVLFAALGLATIAGAYLMQALWSCAGERRTRHARTAFLASALAQDLAWFDTHSAGDLASRLASDVSAFQDGVGERAAQGAAQLVQVVAGFAIAFTISAKLSAVLVATLPVFAAASAVIGRATAAGAACSRSAYIEAGAHAQETLANVRTVAAFGGQARAAKRFDALLDATAREAEKYAWLAGAGFGAFYGFLYLLFGLGYVYGSHLVATGELGGGDVLKCLFAINTGAFAFLGLSPSMQAVSKARGAAARLFAVIESQPALRNGTVTPATLEGRIDFDHVSFAYPSRPEVPVLTDVSFTASPGQRIAIVAKTGSGKSTAAQLLLRFFDATAGTISIDGTPIQDLDLAWFRKHVAIVGQDAALFDTTIAENVAYGAIDPTSVTTGQIERACRAAHAHDFISALPDGYQTRVGERGSGLLSGGQRQRIAIARALVRDPKILILDECTASLDQHATEIVQAALDAAAKGRTTIVIAHRLATIRDADSILVLDHGRIVERGTHAELMARAGAYACMVKAQELISPTTAASTAADTHGPDQLAIMPHSAKPTLTDSPAPTPTASLWRRMLELQRPEWPVLALGVVMGSAVGILLPAFGIILAQVLSVFSLADASAIESQARSWAYVFFALAGGNFVVTQVQFGCFGVAGERLTRRVRKTAFAAMLRQETAWHDAHGTGTLTAQLADHADQIQHLTGPNAASLLQLAVSLATGIAVAAYYSWRMTLIVVACAPVLAAGPWFQTLVIRRTSLPPTSTNSTTTPEQRACDAVQNVATAKSLGIESLLVRQYAASLSPTYQVAIHRAALGSLGFAFAQATHFVLYAIFFGSGYLLVAAGSLTGADLFRTVFVLLYAAVSYGQAAAFTGVAVRARDAAREYVALVDRVPRIRDDPAGFAPVDVAGDIDLSGVEFAYPSRPDAPVLCGFDLRAAAGQHIGIVGGSGQGKTSALALLQRMYDVGGGTVRVESGDVRDWSLARLRESIAVVAQDSALFSGTLFDAIAYGVPDADGPATPAMVEAAARAAQVHDWIASLPDGYATRVGSTRVSGGQRQRLAIARALIRPRARILLLDEYAAALDPATSASVVAAVATVARERGVTVVSVAHQVNVVARCDAILVCEGGRVVERGKHAELVERGGVYAHMVERQRVVANE
ncbi:hypothetical protein H9P43_004455 [Blastocladiella emersonii ATCC 22665]|nr:hypothetical protein H9P43_004440 [Blastocladiella emersonii ATCC 22665]KAI9183537.1 hypothetical protein H9P43_004455 [Blastocladiella emersonii ATCC 22665]